MPAMTCDFDHDLLSGYLDDELDEELRVRVCAHLEGCDACSRQLRAMAQLSNQLAASRQIDVPERLWSRIDEARRARVASESGPPPGRPWLAFGRLRRWAIAAAAVAVVLVLPWISSLRQPGVADEEQADTERFQAPPGIALAKYVEEIQAGDEEAGEFLQMHQARRIPPEEMAGRASFRPWMPEPQTSGFQVEGCYLLSTGCGNAFKLDCVREDERLTIFQQPADGPILLDGQLQDCVDINGVHFRCFVVQDVKVLNWSRGGCSTTIVCRPGAADVESTISSLLQEQESDQ
ncbi:MAG: anti-sigma factor family protein [Planctomycetota bacterium]|jgi:hypothetical protein